MRALRSMVGVPEGFAAEGAGCVPSSLVGGRTGTGANSPGISVFPYKPTTSSPPRVAADAFSTITAINARNISPINTWRNHHNKQIKARQLWRRFRQFVELRLAHLSILGMAALRLFRKSPV